MDDLSLSNTIFLYLALLCVALAFFFYFRSRKLRKKELEWRRSLSQKIYQKMGRKKKKAISGG